MNNDCSSDPSGRRTCSFKCCFSGCSSTNMDLNKKWHKVPNDVNFPKTDKLIQVRNWNVNKKRRFVVLDRLGNKAKLMKTPRWCSDHESKKEFLTKTKFQYKGRTYTEAIKVLPVPINVGEK